MKIRRAQYVATLWTNASSAFPSEDLLPTDYGWEESEGILKPVWFEGPAIPDNLFANNPPDATESEDGSDLAAEIDDGVSDSDGEAWTDDSDSDSEKSDTDCM